MSKYAIEIRPESRDLCTFLNEGVEIPMTEENQFLFVEINGPREITSKVIKTWESIPEDTLVFKP